MYLLPSVSINLKSPLHQEQIEERLADLLEHRTMYWWWEPKPKPFVGTVTATSFEVTTNSVYPQSRWMPIILSGYVRRQEEGSTVNLNFQTRKYRLLGFLWAAFVLYNLLLAVADLISTHAVSLMALGFLAFVVAILTFPYFVFMWAFSTEVDNEKAFFCRLLEAKEVQMRGLVEI